VFAWKRSTQLRRTAFVRLRSSPKNRLEDQLTPRLAAPHLYLQIGGLGATGWMVWHLSVVPRLASESLTGVLGGAIECALIAAGASGFIALGIYLVLTGSPRREAVRAALRTSATAIWFAPATILLTALSPAALGASLVLIVSATRLLYSEWRRIHPRVAAEFVPLRDLALELSPAPLFRRDLIPGMVCSFAALGGVVAILFGYPFLCATLLCVAAAMLTLATLIAGMYEVDRPVTLPRSIFGLLLTVILAAGLTVGGLAFQFGGSSDGPPGESSARRGALKSASELIRKMLNKHEAENPVDSATKVFVPPARNVEITDNSFPGVVLWTDVHPQTKVVAPARKNWLNSMPTRAEQPVSILFTGQYWMLKAPWRVPPAKSLTERGTPLELSFITTDRRPMSMEAHQKLEHPIDLNCCSGIQVDIWNADRYAGTISLELILHDSTASGQPSQSLGVKDVTVWPRWSPFGKPTLPGNQILDFPLPTNRAIRQFDEIEVVFHRDRLRIERSARISIDRFILVPAV